MATNPPRSNKLPPKVKNLCLVSLGFGIGMLICFIVSLIGVDHMVAFFFKNNWWIPGLVCGVCSMGFLLWAFYENQKLKREAIPVPSLAFGDPYGSSILGDSASKQSD